LLDTGEVGGKVMAPERRLSPLGLLPEVITVTGFDPDEVTAD
jgi:hypothetical protein